MTKVTVNDMRRAGVCPRARIWFGQHNLDWRDFVKNGIEADTLRATGDNQVLVEKVIAMAERRTGSSG